MKADVHSSGSGSKRWPLMFGQMAHSIPEYLRGTYNWAYVDRRNARLLDRDLVVNTILLGNQRRLTQAALAEVTPGQRVLQAAHVYGSMIPQLARRIGPSGHLDVVDVVPVQVALCRLKLRGCAHARVRLADVRDLKDDTYDVVNCFFLLHEVPDQYKRSVVDALLARVKPGGKAVFTDYHAPVGLNPLRALYGPLFDWLEPYARTMWHHDVREFAMEASRFRWEKVTMFGGVFQKTVAYSRAEKTSAVVEAMETA